MVRCATVQLEQYLKGGSMSESDTDHPMPLRASSDLLTEAPEAPSTLLLAAGNSFSVTVTNYNSNNRRITIHDEYCGTAQTYDYAPWQDGYIYICDGGSGYGRLRISAWNLDTGNYNGETYYGLVSPGDKINHG